VKTHSSYVTAPVQWFTRPSHVVQHFPAHILVPDQLHHAAIRNRLIHATSPRHAHRVPTSPRNHVLAVKIRQSRMFDVPKVWYHAVNNVVNFSLVDIIDVSEIAIPKARDVDRVPKLAVKPRKSVNTLVPRVVMLRPNAPNQIHVKLLLPNNVPVDISKLERHAGHLRLIRYPENRHR
jgi:hypothetical protein